MLEFVDPGLYFVKDENNFIYPLLQVGSGSGFDEKSTGSGGPKINGYGSSSLHIRWSDEQTEIRIDKLRILTP